MGLRLVIIKDEKIALDHGNDGILLELVQRIQKKLELRSILLRNPWVRDMIIKDITTSYYEVVNDFKEKTITLS